MYRNEEKGFILTDIILQLLFLVLFVFILIWLFPTKGFVNKLQDQLSANTTADYSVLYNRIFNDNLKMMKESAINYYTTPRLPKNFGDKVSMTLGEMLDKKIVLPFNDKNGYSCDYDSSYVEVTKQDEEYQLKVILNCSGEEEYLIVHLGCYQYCEDEVCEKTNDSTAVLSTTQKNYPSTGTTVVEKVPVTTRPVINNNITINNTCEDCNRPVPSPSEPPKEEVYYCKYVNGKYYGKNGNIVTQEKYKEECEAKPEVYYCKYVNGKYYGKNGNVVTQTKYKEECETKPEVYYCKYVNGKYYGKAGNVVTQTKYKEECEAKPEVYYCKYINGKYYGKNGNVVSESTYKTECESKPQKTLYYEYQTKTLVRVPTTREMCTYRTAEKKTENVYSLGYTDSNVSNINRTPFAVKLPSYATNIQIKNVYYGQVAFDLNTYRSDKANGVIYNYEYNDTASSVKDTVSATKLQKYGLSKRHFESVNVLKTRAIAYRNYIEYQIDYRVRLNRSSVLTDSRVSTYHDSRVGDIYYVPVEFQLTYDIVSSNTKVKNCNALTTKEKQYVVSRYTEYDTKTRYEYGPVRWTTNPNLSGVEYTGRTEWR